jgi:hypothetical protein
MDTENEQQKRKLIAEDEAKTKRVNQTRGRSKSAAKVAPKAAPAPKAKPAPTPMDETQSQQKRAASEEATGSQGKKKDMKDVAQALLPKRLALGGGPPPDQKPMSSPGPKQEKPAKAKKEPKTKSPEPKPKTPEAEPAPAASKPEPAKAPTKKEKKKAAASKPAPAEPEPAKASIPVKKDTVKATKATQPAPSKMSMAQLITILSAARAAQKLPKEDATNFQLLFESTKKNKSDKEAKKQIQNSMRELYKNNIYGKA